MSKTVHAKQAGQKKQHDAHSKFKQFDCGQSVLVRNLREGPKWVCGTIVEQTGPVSYNVQVSGQIWRRHIDQLLECSCRNGETENDVYLPASETVQIPNSSTVSAPMSSNSEQGLPSSSAQPTETLQSSSGSKQYPRRDRRPPDRLSH